MQWNLWPLGVVMVIGVPLMTIGVQAALRRAVPSIIAGEHNDVAGQSLPEPTRSRISDLTVRYADVVAGEEWEAMDDGGSSRAAFDLVGECSRPLAA